MTHRILTPVRANVGWRPSPPGLATDCRPALLLAVVLLALVVPGIGIVPARADPGLDTRPSNATCLAPAREDSAGSVSGTWTSSDIGSVSAAGSTTVSGATITVRGSGADIWGSADEFHFARRQLTGDGDIIARVDTLTNTHAWAKAGVMVRESLLPGARFALMLMTPGTVGAAFHYRVAPGGSAAPSTGGDGSSRLPRWVRLSRRGNVLSGYLSTDATNWTLYDSVSLSLPATVYVGPAVTSHADGTVATATFSNVQITGTGDPAPTTVLIEDAFPVTPAFTQPTRMVQAPGDPARWFVLEKTGRIKAFRTDSPTTVTTWLDFSAKVNANSEGGMLGLAFHPLYPGRPEVFVSYTTGSPMQLVISRLLLNNVTTPTAVTEQVLLSIQKPYGNHNGGDLAFGNDGHLYISTGDGGGAGDPYNYAQDRTRLLGKMLRIDAYDRTGWPSPRYRIPADNPHAANPPCGGGANGAPCPELFAWGLRNPWRFSIDGATGTVWAGDVGQSAREEINVIVRGGNYGWRCREGLAAYNTSGCPTSGFTNPVLDYTHTDGNASVTGGYVYRGNSLPFLRGRYVYADFVSGRIWALRDNGSGGFLADELADTAANISSFGVGHDGELYYTDYGSGRLFRLAGATGSAGDPVPDNLVDTGCVSPANPRLPAAGVIPYAVNAPFWSDGAGKVRHLAIPDGTAIDGSDDADWQFPPGTVLMKTMELGGTPVETRLLMRHPDGAWAGYTYEWNTAGTAATRVRGGKTRFIAGQDWIYPSEGQCQQCHTTAAGFTLGLETGQLNGPHGYPLTGRTANQLETLSHIGVLTPAMLQPSAEPRLPSPTGSQDTLDQRARAYLHTNCANCHRPGGPTGVSLDLRYRVPLALADTATCDVTPEAGTLGIADARLVAPGDPSRSVLLQRMLRRDAHGMPPLASSLPDPQGANLISNWISGLSVCSLEASCHGADGL